MSLTSSNRSAPSATSGIEQIVRRYYAAIDCGNIDEVLDLFAADAHYERPGYAPIEGREQLRHFYTRDRVLVGGRHMLDVVVSDAERVSCYGRYVGATRSGESVDVRFADFHRVVDERIAERCTFFFAPAV
jgi:ketosteroid isomerase-like protein